ITEYESKTILKSPLPSSDDPEFWSRWAHAARIKVIRASEEAKNSSCDLEHMLLKVKPLTRMKRTLDQMCEADESWVEEFDKKGVRIEPLWPKQFIENYLFKGAKKIVFSSATIRPKTLNLLGITDFDFFEYPSPFPVERRPIWYVPTVRMRYGMMYEDELKWVTAVDQTISQPLARKIVIHTISFSRQQFLLANSRFSHLMLANSSNNTADVIRAFTHSSAPSILVSPSADTGVDFPGIECETVIIIKAWASNASSKMCRGREREDAEYGPHAAAQAIVQMAGRGMRSMEDR